MTYRCKRAGLRRFAGQDRGFGGFLGGGDAAGSCRPLDGFRHRMDRFSAEQLRRLSDAQEKEDAKEEMKGHKVG